MEKTLKETLKEIQILLGEPQKKLAGSLKYYLNLFNVPESNEKEAEVAPKKGIMESISYKKITWTDILNPNRRLISELAQKYPFHPLHLEDCISKAQFPKIEQSDEDKYLFLLLRFPRFNKELDKIVIHQLCFFLSKNNLVTIHEDPTDAVSFIFDECKVNRQEREVYIGSSSAYLLYRIIEKLTDDLSPLLQTILKEVDETEDVVFDDKLSAIFKLGQLRQKIISLRRVIGPLRTLFAEMVVKINKFSTSNLSVYFEDISHRLDKAWETLEEAREIVEIYKDSDFTFSTEKTNKILAVLTIIFTLSIPATVVGTFYGMNIMLPGGLVAGDWTFWGPFTTLFVLIGLAIIPAILMFLYFRRRGWF